MITLLETPIPILVFGIFALAVLGLLLLRTGRGVLLWGMIGVALLVAAGVGLERIVVTERERIEAVLEAATAALAANDKEGVLVHIDPDNANTRGLVHRAFGMVQFTEAKITQLEISFTEMASPPRATAKLAGRVSFEESRGLSPYESHPIRFTIDLCRRGDTWLIDGHDWKNKP